MGKLGFLYIGLLIPLAALIWVIFKIGWSPLIRRYPACEPAPEAVRKSYQSFSVGLINLGLSVHVAADDQYLHLTPLLVLRWLGAGPISVPWSSITIKKRGKVTKTVTASFDSTTVCGPAWCLDLADPGLR